MMTQNFTIHIPSQDEFCNGYEAYNRKERRGSIYFEALETVTENWGNAELMARASKGLFVLETDFMQTLAFQTSHILWVTT